MKLKFIAFSLCAFFLLTAKSHSDPLQYKEIEFDGPTVVYKNQTYRPVPSTFIGSFDWSNLADFFANPKVIRAEFEEFNTQAIELIQSFKDSITRYQASRKASVPDTELNLRKGVTSYSFMYENFEEKKRSGHKTKRHEDRNSLSIKLDHLNFSYIASMYLLSEETYQKVVDFLPDGGISLPKDFNPMEYLRLNPSLENMFSKPENRLRTKREILGIHYANWGQKGGLKYTDIVPTDFNHTVYLKLNPTLRNLFARPENKGRSHEQILKEHYANWGQKGNLKYQ